MRTKSIALLALASGVLALGVAGFSGLEGGTGLPNLVVNADNNASRHLIVDASNFGSGSGNFTVDGIVFHYEGASVSEDIVTLTAGRVYMTMDDYSGKTKNASGYRGDGFTALNISDLNIEGTGYVIYSKPATTDTVAASYDVTSSIDLTKNGTVNGDSRRRIMLECGASTISFSRLDFTYECVASVPRVEITSVGLPSFGVGEELALTAHPYELFGAVASYSWASLDTDVATVAYSGTSATVTGVSAGTATIRVTMTVDTVDYTDDFEVTVNAAANQVIMMDSLPTTKWQGAGLWFAMNPSSAGTTYSKLNSLVSTMTVETDYARLGSATKDTWQQSTTDTDSRYYLIFGADPLAGAKYSITVTFTDASVSPAVIYKSVAHFNGSQYIASAEITGEDATNVGDSVQLTAVVNEEEVSISSCSWSSSDDSIATVDNDGLVTGVSVGQVTITATITGSNEKVYVVRKQINVLDPDAEKTMVPWYTEGTGNQTNHRDHNGAGLWTWVDITAMGYSEFNDFSDSKILSVSYSTTSIRFEVWSDHITVGGHKIGRLYFVLGAASDGVLKIQIKQNDGSTAYGSITFVDEIGGNYNENID